MGVGRRQRADGRCPRRRPGVFSARFSGEGATDQSNNRLLLERLADVPLEKRRPATSVTWRCPIRGHHSGRSEGACRGRILFEGRGTGGFGYDPLFEIVEYHRTFGELSPRVKACLSHRARAARRLIPQLIALVDGGVMRGEG